MLYYLFFLIVLFCSFSDSFSWDNQDISELAYINVPVADAALKPLQFLDLNRPVDQIYKEMSFSGEKSENACPRFHQLLFNEVVKIKKELNNEVQCELFNLFYENRFGQKLNTVWLLKKNLTRLADLPKKVCTGIPHPYSADLKKSLTKVVTLTDPWHDPISHKIYSAGTRFIHASQRDTDSMLGILLIDPKLNQLNLAQISRELAIVDYPHNRQACLKAFVQLLRKWATQKKAIPYVWGGCSYVQTYTVNNFALRETNRFGERLFFWSRPRSTYPKTGFDCSGLILRVAQIYGMPYFFKNTSSIKNNLEQLKASEKLSEGDLIWYLGHVLVISNIKENKVVEAVGYLTGFGRVHEIHIAKVFKNIHTFQDLKKAYFSQRQLERLDNTGQAIRQIYEFKLLKMSSIWEK